MIVAIHDRCSKSKYLTLAAIHGEYQAEFGVRAYRYSQFTNYYRRYCRTIDTSIRLRHEPGGVLYVDFTGTRIPWKDAKTGVAHKAEIFVSTLGYSGLLLVWVCCSQKVEDWILAHVKAFEFYGGTPECVIPDNLKSAVT